ncbi:MAG: hypothetical protein HY847_10330 [Betaproteobacteria bacterium]|nr:hypothetical protein [Betaproteobacteria bacterium]
MKAISKSTPRPVRDDSDSTSPKIDRADIYPLIPTYSPEDTMLCVSEILAFLSGAMENAEGSSESIPWSGGCMGLSRILDACRYALNYHLEQKGGAA